MLATLGRLGTCHLDDIAERADRGPTVNRPPTRELPFHVQDGGVTDESSSRRGDPDVSFRFERERSAPGGARAALRPLLSDDDDPIAESVTLAASELVSNVVQHTAGGGTVEAWDPKPDVPFRLEVSDDDPRLPTEASEPSEHGGRGLHIVDQVSDAWGIDPSPSGKTVWVEFDRRRRAALPRAGDEQG